MLVRKQQWIMRSDLVNNPDVTYIFGDNEERQGLGGQAKEMRGQPNSVGVATKRLPSQMDDSYWTDDHAAHNLTVMYNDLYPVFEGLLQGKPVVIPSDGIGTGLSELPTRAPLTNQCAELLLTRLGTVRTVNDWNLLKLNLNRAIAKFTAEGRVKPESNYTIDDEIPF